jgi:hypothetical protein
MGVSIQPYDRRRCRDERVRGDVAIGCGICESDLASAKTLHVKEMMYGTREVFDSVICPSCGCVQLAAVPDNL